MPISLNGKFRELNIVKFEKVNNDKKSDSTAGTKSASGAENSQNTSKSELEKAKEQVKSQRLEIYEKMTDVINQLRLLKSSMPERPEEKDFKKEDGTTDTDAYNAAVQQYDAKKADVEAQIQELNKRLSELIKRDKELNELQQKLDNMSEEDFAKLLGEMQEAAKDIHLFGFETDETEKTDENVYKTVDEALTQNFNNTFSALAKEADEIQKQMEDMEVPTPPSRLDYANTADYEKAMEEFKKADADYKEKQAELEKQLKDIQSKQKEFEALNNVLNDVISGKITGKAAEQIMQALEVFAQSTEEIEDAGKDINEQRLALQNEAAKIKEELENMEVPTPPSRMDFMREDGSFDKLEYDKAMEKYQQEMVEFMTKQSDLEYQMLQIKQQDLKLQQQMNELGEVRGNSIPQSVKNGVTDAMKTVMSETVKEMMDIDKQLLELKHEKMLIEKELNAMVMTPPSKSDFMTEDGHFDEMAYDIVMQVYVNSQRKYPELTARLEEIDTEVKNLENQLTELQAKYNDAAAVVKDFTNNNRTSSENIKDIINNSINNGFKIFGG